MIITLQLGYYSTEMFQPFLSHLQGVNINLEYKTKYNKSTNIKHIKTKL